MNIHEVLQKNRGKIFNLLIREYPLTITEISEKLNIPQPHTSDYIKDLEKNHLVRIEFDDKSGHGIRKKCYPTFKKFYEDMATKLRKKLTDQDFEIIDDLMLDPKFYEVGFSNVKKATVDDPLVFFGLFLGNSIPELEKKLEKYPDLKKKAEKYSEVHKKLFS